jgi:hypothetical protein
VLRRVDELEAIRRALAYGGGYASYISWAVCVEVVSITNEIFSASALYPATSWRNAAQLILDFSLGHLGHPFPA